MNLFGNNNKPLDRFDELVINKLYTIENLLNQIQKELNFMSDKSIALAEALQNLSDATTARNERDTAQDAKRDESQAASETKVTELQALLDAANALNAQTDADLTPLIESIQGLIDTENAADIV